ncbi:MAG TPA: diacylglycerol kinase family protein [Polyangia bacterium]|nr:diacylglycerol kinase family protein [Polyangia bacterium]
MAHRDERLARRRVVTPARRAARGERRASAVVAIASAVATVAIATALAVIDPWRGMLGLALLVAAVVVGWHGLRRHGGRRWTGLGAGVLLLAGVAGLSLARHPLLLVGVVAGLALASVAGGYALLGRVVRPAAPRPRRPVMIYNPRSGGGKATRYRLADEARARGIDAIELVPGADLAQLVRQALDGGADAVAMAGGDGSQAIAAGIAAERDVPYACIPAGTRNHFALDLGVDRNDVVGALDAFVDGGERVVDLGEVNGRFFVNNVSLGLYGEAVQRPAYRDAKVRTLLQTLPELDTAGAKLELQWRGQNGQSHGGSTALLVSNNPYRFDPGLGAGSRPRLDQQVLGIAVIGAPGDDVGFASWTSPSFEVMARGPVPVGIDGEARLIQPPLRFRVRPAALRCRIARHHPGASPAAFAPERPWNALRVLAGIAAGRDPRGGVIDRASPR